MVERGRKIHEEKRGETRGGKGERRMFTGVPSLSPPPPASPVFSLYNLTRFPITAVVYYLNASGNRLDKGGVGCTG